MTATPAETTTNNVVVVVFLLFYICYQLYAGY
jgi:hypothetical protein